MLLVPWGRREAAGADPVVDPRVVGGGQVLVDPGELDVGHEVRRVGRGLLVVQPSKRGCKVKLRQSWDCVLPQRVRREVLYRDGFP